MKSAAALDSVSTTGLFPMSYLRFFLPLAIQAIAQALTHPLVAMVASHAPGGTLNLAGLAQANTVAYFLQTLSFGLLTTGMVYGRSRTGFRVFLRAWVVVGCATLGAHSMLALPGPSRFLFGRVIGLPADIEAPARVAFVAGIPVRILFHLRLPFQVVLLNNRAAGKNSAAAVGRVALTLLLAPLFVSAGLVGPAWALVCLTIPVVGEVVAVLVMARPYLRSLSASGDKEKPPSVGALLAFTLPLSSSTAFVVLSGNVLAAFIARAPRPELVLPVYHLALSISGTVAFAATQVQRVVLAFAPQCLRDRAALRFAALVGIVAGLLPLLFQLEPLRTAYFVTMQNLSPDRFRTLRLLVLMLLGQPLMLAFRARLEGVAAYLRTPMVVLVGYSALLVSMALAGGLALAVNLPGLYIGPVGTYTANVVAIVVMGTLLRRPRREFLAMSAQPAGPSGQ
jgi:hypothetical protein